MVEALPLLFALDVVAFRIDLTLAKQFNAQIRVEKTPCGSRAVCVGKKINIKRYGGSPAAFVLHEM